MGIGGKMRELGRKKHRKCENIANKKYIKCYICKAQIHYWAECIKEFWGNQSEACYGEGNYIKTSDWINYKTAKIEPAIRMGKFID